MRPSDNYQHSTHKHAQQALQVPDFNLNIGGVVPQHGSKRQPQHGVVRVVPGGVQHVRLIAGGAVADSRITMVKFHATSSNLTFLRYSDNYQHQTHKHAGQHSKVTLSEWNIGLLDGLN
ncbi:hypothetical protein DFH27DRAFT_618906 [Peziza echinospora]|nr:hypothetical protein DFH27DRAFT_618906 [Peziza echinospora]